MKNWQILEKCGASPSSYSFVSTSPEIGYKIPDDRKIVYRLPAIFSEFSQTETLLFPSKESSNLWNHVPSADLKEDFESIVENQIFHNQSMKGECVFDRSNDQKDTISELSKH